MIRAAETVVEAQTARAREVELSHVLDDPSQFIGEKITVVGNLTVIGTTYSAKGLGGFLGACDRFPRLRIADSNGRTLSCPYSKDDYVDADLVGSLVAVSGTLIKQSWGDWVFGATPLAQYFTNREDRLYLRTESMTPC